jgi:hypothetical protein
MKSRKNPRQTETRETRALPHGDSADEILEFVFNDEEDALSSEHAALTHQRDMPALQEFLREMSELDSRNLCVQFH